MSKHFVILILLTIPLFLELYNQGTSAHLMAFLFVLSVGVSLAGVYEINKSINDILDEQLDLLRSIRLKSAQKESRD